MTSASNVRPSFPAARIAERQGSSRSGFPCRRASARIAFGSAPCPCPARPLGSSPSPRPPRRTASFEAAPGSDPRAGCPGRTPAKVEPRLDRFALLSRNHFAQRQVDCRAGREPRRPGLSSAGSAMLRDLGGQRRHLLTDPVEATEPGGFQARTRWRVSGAARSRRLSPDRFPRSSSRGRITPGTAQDRREPPACRRDIGKSLD